MRKSKKVILNAQQKQAVSSFTAGLSAAILLIALISLVVFIMIKGTAYFWPANVFKVTTISATSPSDTGQVFVKSSVDQAEFISALENRLETQFSGNKASMPEFEVEQPTKVYQINLLNGDEKLGVFSRLHTQSGQYEDIQRLAKIKAEVNLLQADLRSIQDEQLTVLHRKIANLDQKNVEQGAPARLHELELFDYWQSRADELSSQIEQYSIEFTDAMGNPFRVAVKNTDTLFLPNQLSLGDKFAYSASKIFAFVSESPKQASTSGGVFPALFGTVLMVLIMAIIVAPFGAMAAIYLHEYAPNNKLTSIIRICVSNMAGVPSVVYGVFGLGFFVYFLGGSIDSIFFSEALPSPTFGTPGLFWAALTMALLTLPVVIVSTEEGLRRVPEGLRAGSYALGATKIETILKTVLPIASPGIMTGVILAVARAAGEVAPLILVGAVKFAPSLPVDSDFPFLHLERQFMHLGVFIYDGAFHNQTNTQGSSMMFASCMLLLLIVFVLNLFAIIVRKRLRDRFLRL
ncbi:phosphate ABC transporter permease PstA [Glaciecola sp. MH2013]|nr:phosphate ABC transporter permease PstA [Glaciecola sp. MH2013]